MVFRCNVDGCEAVKNFDKAHPENKGEGPELLWMDANYHFVKHHPELHLQMVNHLLIKKDGKFINYSQTDIEKIKSDIDAKTVASSSSKAATAQSSDE